MKESRRLSRLKLIPTNLNHQAEEFFSNSTLHGVRYINENGRAFGEKFMWFCCVAIGFVISLIIIDSLWEKFQTDPTITGLDTDFQNHELDFPTVSVCPVDVYDIEKINETSLKITKDDDDERFGEILILLSGLTYDKMEEIISQPKDILDKLKNNSLRQLVFETSISCEDLFNTCRFRDESIPCCEHFHSSFNERGFCYSFNARYTSNAIEEIRHQQTNFLMETDKRWQLSFRLNKYSKVYLHSVDDITSLDTLPLFENAADSNSVESLISMKQTYTTEDADELTVKQRKCIFQYENHVNYFKENDIYSLTSCMTKCRMDKAQKYCNCIPPFYAPASGKYKPCNVDQFACLVANRTLITNITGCRHCELSCFSTVYETEKFTYSNTGDNETTTNIEKEKDFYVSIEFLSWPIIRYKKEVLFGFVDLLVSFGGIAGLFLGFSLLSGIEIIYYFSMRACCMFVENREELYKLQDDKDSRPPVIYDLSLTPKFNRDNLQSSASLNNNVKMVKPVDKIYKEFDFSTSRKQTMNNLMFVNDNEINTPKFELDRAQVPFFVSHARKGRQQKVHPKRGHRNIFSQQFNSDPYSRVEKPFRNRQWKTTNENEPVFYGYLP